MVYSAAVTCFHGWGCGDTLVQLMWIMGSVKTDMTSKNPEVVCN